MRSIGTTVRGIRAPIIRQGDDLVSIVAQSVQEASQEVGFAFHDKDVVAVTESVVARAYGNYASVDAIAEDVRNKFGTDSIGIIFPILSRNRFAICLRGFAKAMKKITIMLSFPDDEVGNHLFDEELLDTVDINPWTDVLTEDEYRAKIGYPVHPFTGVDYVTYYRQLVEDCGCECEIIFANHAEAILAYQKNVLLCDIHSRKRTKKRLLIAGAEKALGLDEILTSSVNGSGYNEEYGLLGSNKATEDTVKLFPRDCQKFVDALSVELHKITGKQMECMIYGDGAFKDPVGKIWELADPVVSPAYSAGLSGTPNELKLKYLADNDFNNLNGKELADAIRESIKDKNGNLKGNMASEGTTPRQLTDLIGSLCDLTSGSGDKGTPIVLIQGYFDNYSMEE